MTFPSLQFYHIDAKLMALSSDLMTALEKVCGCGISPKYLLLNSPMCFPLQPEWLVLSGRLVATDNSSSTEIRSQLGHLAAEGTKVKVEGVILETLNCLVDLKEGEVPYCRVLDTEETSTSAPSSISTAAVVVGVVVCIVSLIPVVFVAIIVVTYCKRRVKHKRTR